MQAYARVTIYNAGTLEAADEYVALVRLVRSNDRTMAAYPLGRLYEGYTGMMVRLSNVDDQVLEVANLSSEKGLVVYIDYFRMDGRPWFDPPRSSQDTWTLKHGEGQSSGQAHTFSAKDFLLAP